MRDNVAATDMFNFLSCVYVIKEVANMKLRVTIDSQDHLLRSQMLGTFILSFYGCILIQPLQYCQLEQRAVCD